MSSTNDNGLKRLWKAGSRTALVIASASFDTIAGGVPTGATYPYQSVGLMFGKPNRRISLFVDEVSHVINQPLIEILNKGAEGGIQTTCGMQTLADLSRRLGSEDAARMALGNLNNLVALRSKDRPTQDFVVETFGKTAIHTVRVGLSSSADAHLGDFSSSYSTQLTQSFEEMVPADVLGKLPNLQYFASVSGGRIIKGRFPILDPDDAASTDPAVSAGRHP